MTTFIEPTPWAMSRVWQAVLGVEVGEDDDFFDDLSGDSLRAVEIVDSVFELFGVELPLQRFLDPLTPRACAADVERRLANGQQP
jgi:acyl carrier protein